MENETTIKHEPANSDLGAVSGSFVCTGCGHDLPMNFQMRTEGYCYMCDPNVTTEELLADDDSDNEMEFECCANCDLPDACSDFGCAIQQGLRGEDDDLQF